MEVMLILQFARNRNPKEPIRANGIVVMTMTENFTDSNCAAITTNTRKIAIITAWNKALNSSPIRSSMAFWAHSTVEERFGFTISRLILFSSAVTALSSSVLTTPV